MRLGTYALATVLIAIGAHFVFIYATPRVLMNVAFDRVGVAGPNTWQVADRVTPISRTIVRPSPDFAYSACAYDLSDGPLRIRVNPWHQYWSLSLYAGNSDNFFVTDDREARRGADIILIRRGARAPEDVENVVRSPSTRGIALIRRLAPTLDEYNRAREVSRGDACSALVQ